MPKEKEAESGGMFARDKEFGNRLDLLFPLRSLGEPVGNVYERSEPFVLWGVEMRDGTIDTQFGAAESAALEVQRVRNGALVGERETATTLASAIVDKCRQALPSDFPAVVELRRVDSSYGTRALVLQFVRAFDPRAASRAPSTPTPATMEDDIPY